MASPSPALLYVVRHGESAGNVARGEAEAQKRPMIDVDCRDVDVPLSALGERQATALGRWIGALPAEQRPTVVLTSPYLRARTTVSFSMQAAGAACAGVPVVIDERLREKEFGILDGLTKLGVLMKYPEQAELRRIVGKFYHRPPGGESWCDVILRLRSMMDTITRDLDGERVLVIAHQVVVHGMRYLVEGLTEQEILAIDKAEEIANCSVTSYVRDEAKGRLVLHRFNFVAPLEEAGEAVTSKPDAPVAPK